MPWINIICTGLSNLIIFKVERIAKAADKISPSKGHICLRSSPVGYVSIRFFIGLDLVFL